MKEIATQGVSKMAIEWREYALKDQFQSRITIF